MGGFDIYKAQKTKGFNSNFVTKLLRNYRWRPMMWCCIFLNFLKPFVVLRVLSWSNKFSLQVPSRNPQSSQWAVLWRRTSALCVSRQVLRILRLGLSPEEGNVNKQIRKQFSFSLLQFSYFSVQDFPVVFHGVAGCHEIDANCTSVYNTAEVEVLKKYLKALLTHLEKKGVTEIGPDEIGIITPYRKQASIL